MTNAEVRMTVDGQSFSVVRDATQSGAYHFEWLNSDEPGYGFSVRRSSDDMSPAAAESAIRQFLEQIDPHSQRLT